MHDHDTRSPARARVAAAAFVFLAAVTAAIAVMTDPAVSAVLLTLVVVFGIGGWYLIKALGGRPQPLDHGGRGYEPPEEHRRDVA